MNRIKGKLIVITGASSGIGLACAEQCASRGANLVLAARRIERLHDLKSRLGKEHPVSVDIQKLDVRDRAGVRSFADDLKMSSRFPDVLINNAVLYIISAPEHVNIQELVIMPTAQRNVYVWDHGGG